MRETKMGFGRNFAVMLPQGPSRMWNVSEFALSQFIGLPITEKQFTERAECLADIGRLEGFQTTDVYQSKDWTGLATMLTMVLNDHNNNAHLDQPGLPEDLRVSFHVCSNPAPERRVSFCRV